MALDPCARKECKAPGVIRDDSTWKHYCWDHREGVREQTCGCEYDIRSGQVLIWCEPHGKIQKRIDELAPTKKKKKRKVKNG